jgi:hypothetical protein
MDEHHAHILGRHPVLLASPAADAIHNHLSAIWQVMSPPHLVNACLAGMRSGMRLELFARCWRSRARRPLIASSFMAREIDIRDRLCEKHSRDEGVRACFTPVRPLVIINPSRFEPAQHAFVKQSQTKILAAQRIWSSDRSGNTVFPMLPRAHLPNDCNG